MAKSSVHSLILSLLLVLLCPSCQRQAAHGADATADSVTFSHATLLHIYTGRGYRLVVIDNPWHPGEVLHRYVMVPRKDSLPADLPEGTLLRTPLRRLTAGTSVIAVLMDELGALDHVAGICDLQYVISPRVRDAVKAGKIQDIGLSANINVERLMASGCDALMLSPYDRVDYGAVTASGLPIIECADYMEVSPLARAEWVRWYGMLVGEEERADSLYRKVAADYETLRRRAARLQRRPTVFVDLMTSGIWYQPGGNSTVGQLIKDAGASYVFGNNSQKGSVGMTMESVYAGAHDADIWLIKYGGQSDLTYSALRDDDERYSCFGAWQQRHIWGCNLLRHAYFEQGAFHPERILGDMISICHPQLMPGYRLQYFSPLQ